MSLHKLLRNALKAGVFTGCFLLYSNLNFDFNSMKFSGKAIAGEFVSQVKITFPWKEPKTPAEKRAYEKAVKKYGQKADLKYMEKYRKIQARRFTKKTLETLLETPDDKFMNAKGWHDLLTSDEGQLLEEVAGKVKINGTQMNLAKAMKYIKTNKCNFEFFQETSDGLKIEVGNHKPTNFVYDGSKISRSNTVTPKKYKVLMQGLDSGKVFTDYSKAEEFVKECEKLGYKAEIVDKVVADTIDRKEVVRKQLREYKKQYEKINKPKQIPNEPTVDYSANSDFFTCKTLLVKGRKHTPQNITNRFSSSDQGVWIGYKVGGRITTEILYNGRVIETRSGKGCGTGAYEGNPMADLLRKGGYGRYEVRIYQGGSKDHLKTLEFFIDK